MRPQLPLAAVLLASSTAACVRDDAAPLESAESIESALEQENGGFETTDEAPMFGQRPAFEAARIESDVPVNDTMNQDATVTALANLPSNGVDAAKYRVAIVWGQLPPDRNNPTARTWSGDLSLNRGAMVVGRRIGFEPDTDQLLPREVRDRIDFESVTKPFADGLALRVLDGDPANAEPLSLTYTAADASATYSFDLSQLAAGPIVVDAGGGQSMIATALREPPTDCEHGFLRGRWHAVPDHEGLGVYRGVIANAEGEVTGHIRGIWGIREDGTQAMFGKFIAVDGSFRGIVRGEYNSDGGFRARWITEAGDHGILGGHYRTAPDNHGGGFMGRWADSACAPQQPQQP